jgi:hypothetical protein
MKLLGRLKHAGLTLNFFYIHVGRKTDLQKLSMAWKPELDEYESGFLLKRDMSEVANCEEWLSEALLLDRLQRGLKCFAVKHRGRIVSYLWCAFEEINDPCYQMNLGKNEVHLFNAYTLPEYRGKNLAPFMRHQCYDALNDTGIEKFYSLCDVFNTPSMRYRKKMNASIQKLGFYFALGDKYSRHWILKEYDIL